MRRRINLNQLSLPFGEMPRVINSYHNRAVVFLILAGISLLSLVIYIFSINATARNIAHRQELERQIANVRTNLDGLEFSYIELKNNVTLELAHQHGFKEVNNPLYVSRNKTSLSFNNK